MRCTFFLCVAILTATNCLHAKPEQSAKTAEGKSLQARIDEQDRQIAGLTAYTERLRCLLIRAGVDVGRPPGMISPAKKMQRILPRVRCNNVRLTDAIISLARVADIDIKVDWKALAEAGAFQATLISCDLGATSADDALRAMLFAANPSDFLILVGNSAVDVTTQAQLEKRVVTRTYDVKNILPRDRSIEEAQDSLLKLVTDTVAPDSWKDAGGALGSISFKGYMMSVTQTLANLEAVERLLEELDIEKDNEHDRRTIDERDHQIAALDAEIDKLAASCRSLGIRIPARLDQAIGVVIPDVQFIGTPLSACFYSLAAASGQLFFVNWKSLQAAGFDGYMPITLTLRHQTLAEAIRALLDKASQGNHQLAYGTADNVITVSRQEDFDQATITRTYDIRDLIIRRDTRRGAELREKLAETRQEAIDRFIQALTTTIEPDSWRDAGGTLGSVRELQGTLIVTQSERTQGRIKAWLNAWQNKLKLIRRE